MFEQVVDLFLAQIEQADAEAREAQLAFAVGKFDEYLKRMAEKAAKRLGDEYEQSNTAGGNSRADSGGTTGSESSGGSGGIGRSPENAPRSRE